VARRRSTYFSILNLWPFVGILVSLLFLFFADAGPIHHDPSGFMDLPEIRNATGQPDVLREDAI